MSSIAFEARDIHYRYPRSTEAIRGISFHIRKGEKIAFVGPNGAGKSTLLLMFNGMIRPDSGILLFDNEPIRYDSSSMRTIRKRVGFVLQNPDRQIIAPTVWQDVAFGPVNLGYDNGTVRESVGRALREVGLAGFERRPPHRLSGGEKKRVAIAGVLAMDPDVLVLDEPTSSLDPSGSEEIMELLDELNQEGKTVIISTHDVELAYPWADRVILLLNGRILQEDVPDVAFGDPEYVRMAHLSMPVLLDLALELGKRGYPIPARKPRTVLDMLNIIDSLLPPGGGQGRPASITVCSVDQTPDRMISEWIAARPCVVTGAMGTRAKQRVSAAGIRLDFSFGVIDKCICKSLLGEETMILTTDAMLSRVMERVGEFCRENPIQIPILVLSPGEEEGRREE